MTDRQRRTKILATLGPATDPPGVLDELFRAGVNVVRLNFSHGDPSGQAKRAVAVRAAAQRVRAEVGILADLPGPKIRVEKFAELLQGCLDTSLPWKQRNTAPSNS